MLQDRMCLFVVKGMEGTIRLVCVYEWYYALAMTLWWYHGTSLHGKPSSIGNCGSYGKNRLCCIPKKFSNWLCFNFLEFDESDKRTKQVDPKVR